jgi:hypothetical protein
MSHLLVKAIRVRVLNSPKVSLYGTRIIFLMQQQSQVPSGDIGSKVARPRRQSPLNILGCFALLHALRAGKLRKRPLKQT